MNFLLSYCASCFLKIQHLRIWRGFAIIYKDTGKISKKLYHTGAGTSMKISLEHLTKKFPGRGRKSQGDVTAVNDLTLEIPDGALVALLGPSGCGKSTTLNLICGLETPTEGRIYFGEQDITSLAPEHRGVGMVFQNYALYP